MAKHFYRPVQYTALNQRFGENRACVDTKTGRTTITCDGLNPPAGYKSVYSQMRGHNGLDYHALRWTQIYAAREGEVVEVETEQERGLGIGILHKFYVDTATGQELTVSQAKSRPHKVVYYKTRYWHLIAMDVHIGDRVWTGSLIGYADSTGYSSGDHLHFEVKETDSRGNTINNNNGFFGAVDPLPLMYDDFARDVNLLRLSLEKAASMLDAISDKLRGR